MPIQAESTEVKEEITQRDIFIDILNKYHKNLKTVSKEDLSGKYAKAFAKQKHLLLIEGSKYACGYLREFLSFDNTDEGYAIFIESNNIVEKHAVEICKLILESDISILDALLQQLRDEYVSKTWYPYALAAACA